MAAIIVPRVFDFQPVATSGRDPREMQAQAKRERECQLNKELHAWQMANYSPDDIADTCYRPLVLGYYAFFLAHQVKREAKSQGLSELHELNRCLRMMGQKFDKFNAQTIKSPLRQHLKSRVLDLHELRWDDSYQKPLWTLQRYYRRLGDSAERSQLRADAHYGYLLIRVLERCLSEAEQKSSERYGKQIVLPMQDDVAWLKDYFEAVMHYDYQASEDDAIIGGILYNKASSITGEDVSRTLSEEDIKRAGERAIWWYYGFGE